MANVHPNYKYTKEHEWLSIENNIVTIGITDYAQNSLGDIVYIDLPQVNTDFQAKEVIGTIESVKAVSDIYTPIACKILEVNANIIKTPELLNTDPYKEGWLIKVEVDLSHLDSLMTDKEYSQYIETL